MSTLKDAGSLIKKEKDHKKLSIVPSISATLPHLAKGTKPISISVLGKGSQKKDRSWLSPLRVRNDSLMGSGTYLIE